MDLSRTLVHAEHDRIESARDTGVVCGDERTQLRLIETWQFCSTTRRQDEGSALLRRGAGSQEPARCFSCPELSERLDRAAHGICEKIVRQHLVPAGNYRNDGRMW